MAVRKRVVAQALRSWLDLNRRIASMSEEEVLHAMELESERDPPRKTIIRRLVQRRNGIHIEKLLRELGDRA